MLKLDPIIAVKDVNASAVWYETVFDCKRKYGGEEFAVLLTEKKEVLICLHKWGEHEHPTMADPDLTPGNGLILYFKTDKLETIYQRLQDMQTTGLSEIAKNPNSNQNEFSLRDPNGYYIIITEYHEYEG